MDNLTKQEYLIVKKQLINGEVTEKGWRLFYDYYTIKKGEFRDVSFDEFMANFNLFLQHAYGNVLKLIIAHYDREYTVTKVIKISDNSVLTEF